MGMETPPPPRRTGPVPRMAAVPLVALVAVGFIYAATRPLGGEPQPSFFVIGSAVPGVQIGQIAPGTAQAPGSPSLAVTGLDGAPIELRDFTDHPIWIIFWKTACPPCEAEAADVAAAYAAHHAEGLVILGVDVWDTSAVVHDYALDHPLDYPIGITSTSGFMEAYGVWGAPTHYFIDPGGIIRDRYFGPMMRELIEESLQRII